MGKEMIYLLTAIAEKKGEMKRKVPRQPTGRGLCISLPLSSLIQFYQPFDSINEKMSRLWQTLLLIKEHPSFEFLPWEKELLTEKKKYYSRLPGRDLSTDATEFVIYILEIIHTSLSGLLESCRKSIRPMDRIRYFYNLGLSGFTRKDYMLVHKNISTATASRDLDLGVETGFFTRHGSHNQSIYRCYLLSE